MNTPIGFRGSVRPARLVRMSEGNVPQIAQPMALQEVVVTSSRIGGAPPPVSAGELDVRVQVNAVYELSR